MEEELDRVEPRLHGIVKRNWRLWLAVAIVFTLSPSITRLIDHYRAIVLDVKEEKMLLTWSNKPPKWLDADGAQPGEMVVKEGGEWSAKHEPPQPQDEQLVTLYKRYTSTYTGKITDINDPSIPGHPKVATIQLDNGDKVFLPLQSEQL